VKSILFALLASTMIVAGARAADLPACDLGDGNWREDPVLVESRLPSERNIPIGPITCQTANHVVYPWGPDKLHILRAKLFEGDGPAELRANLIVLSRGDTTGQRVIARFLVPSDLARQEPTFEPGLSKVGDDFVLQLSARGRTAYRLSGDRVVPFDAHAWVEAARAAAGNGWTPGRVRELNFDTLEAALWLHRTGSDDPASPGSAFDNGRIVKIKLAFEGDRLVGREAVVGDWNLLNDSEVGIEVFQAQESLKRARRRLPAGTEPCALSGWSADDDPAGLSIRAEPSDRARVLGRVPPPWSASSRGAPDRTYRAAFDIIGYRSGWFLINAVKAPGTEQGLRYPSSRPQPYRGRGWVPAAMVSATLADSGLQFIGRLMQAPHLDAAMREVSRGDGLPIGRGDVVQRLHACSSSWALVEFGGTRGWWRGTCSERTAVGCQ
jgi:hypothetical protein